MASQADSWLNSHKKSAVLLLLDRHNTALFTVKTVMKLHVAQLVLAAAAMLSTSTGSASSIPAECEADTNCSICVKVARTQLILTAMSTPQNCVLTGKWDEKIQACIDGDCSSTEEGCIEGLQTWINATSVDIDALNGETVGGGGIICNKAGSVEAVDVVKEDGVRCKVMDPPQSTLDGMKTIALEDGVSGKVFDSNCVVGRPNRLSLPFV